MKRVAFKMFLNAGAVAEYKKRHDEIWQELRELLKAYGVTEYSIFLDEARLELFAVLSIQNPAMLEKLKENPLMQKWWQHMKDIMQTNHDASPKTVNLTEVFYLP